MPCRVGRPQALRRVQEAEGFQEGGEAAREEGATYRRLFENQHIHGNRKLRAGAVQMRQARIEALI